MTDMFEADLVNSDSLSHAHFFGSGLENDNVE